MRREFIILSLGLACLLAAGALADSVVLHDGTRLVGEVKKIPEGYRVTTEDGKVTIVKAEQIRSIELGGSTKANPRVAAQAGLASLRRSVEYSSDLNQIIERYRRFIEITKDPATLAEAEKDLAVWQDRLDRQMVKVGSNWVTPEERDALASQAGAQVEEAFALMAQGRLREADPVLARALEVDPQNVAGLYLRGILLYRLEQLSEARKLLEAVNELIRDHAPTLNNLAIIHWRQNHQTPAMNFMSQALLAAPMNRLILDNAAEMLAVNPDEQRRNPAAAKLFRHFVEQDQRMQEAMARQGMYRWGATWVDRATIDRLRQQEREIKEKMDQMQAEFDSARIRLERIDYDIREREQLLRQIESTSYYRTPDGRLIRMPLPEQYYDTQREVSRLRTEKAELAAKVETLKQQAKRVPNELPTPKFTGVQSLIWLEGAPMKLPATQPMPGEPMPGEPMPAPSPGAMPPPSPEPPATMPVPNEPLSPPPPQAPGPGPSEPEPQTPIPV